MSASLIRYFRDCYEADTRRTTIWNIFKAEVEQRRFVEGTEELLNGQLPHTPVDAEWGEQAREAVHLYRKEKELLYCSLFVVGRLPGEEGATRPLCAPLLLHPAELVSQPPHVFIRPHLQERRINEQVLKQLQSDADDASVYERLAGVWAPGVLTLDQILEGAALLEAMISGLDGAALYDYPSLSSERQVRSLVKAPDGPYRVVPASCVVLVRKSVETRGVLNELAALAEGAALSTPLRILLGGSEQTSSLRTIKVGRVPAILSAAQEQVLRQGATSPVTLVIGPPGTGKSYTIAALALEHLSRGETVLIASKMNHAVDVVGTKIEQKLAGETIVVRGGRRQYLRDLKAYLKELVSGMHTAETPSREKQRKEERSVVELEQWAGQLERQIEQQNRREIAWGRILRAGKGGMVASLKERFVRWRVRRSVPLWELVDNLALYLEARDETLTALIRIRHQRRLADLLRTHRAMLTTFSKAIRARTGSRQEHLFASLDFNVLLRAFPVWLVNLADLHKVLPLGRELFDLAIIDEATQCDIASCLPLLQRARRVVITGDPNQLRHISFLAKDRQRMLYEKHALPPADADRYNYREKSILDLVNDHLSSQEHVVFLNEHFRSVPSIIAFSNRTFYAGALRVMTERPGREGPHPVRLVPCHGHRDPEGRNFEEAERLLDEVAARIDAQHHLATHHHHVHSIGILSPFRSQVDYLTRQLTQRFSLAQLGKHDLLVGTAHTFQGEERDIMFLSLVIDPETHPATLRFLERPDVFNVAITRARLEQHLYSSFEPAALPPDSLLRTYLDAISRGASETTPGDPTSVLESTHEVQRALETRGFTTWVAYPIAGLTMDVVAARAARSCGIDLIGFAGPFEPAFPLERYKMFYRAGLKLVPIPFTRWMLDREQCLDAIMQSVEKKPTMS